MTKKGVESTVLQKKREDSPKRTSVKRSNEKEMIKVVDLGVFGLPSMDSPSHSLSTSEVKLNTSVTPIECTTSNVTSSFLSPKGQVTLSPRGANSTSGTTPLTPSASFTAITWPQRATSDGSNKQLQHDRLDQDKVLPIAEDNESNRVHTEFPNISEFYLIRRISNGASGQVYEVFQKGSQVKYALKILQVIFFVCFYCFDFALSEHSKEKVAQNLE
ncbi:hypothetical protein RFI_20728 [Reticulomyxa filosa]|uniref:Protein kinase domain-containing protein n=1 Tax=Reticulomyxa filosa TaxID=46433 RepID=X6MRG9_RETFI|nr:hypothetical protein RFI_20728 [Reticulomyxa filosa]|eukprot:ETO16613.1 hypothetical protein RFI_20728 [Reticulomyxa filosa]